MHIFTTKYSQYIALSVLITTGFACKKETATDTKSTNTPQNMPVAIEGVIVKPSALTEKIEVTGTLIPYEETVLMPEVAGRIVQLNLPEGQQVSKGTVLVKLFDGDLQAQLKKLEVQLQIAEATEKRQQELIKVNGISQQEYDLSVLQISNIKADIELIKVQIAKTEIKAPYNGKIGLKKVSVGAYVTPTTSIATIRDDATLKLNFSVPEKYSPMMKAGKKVLFTTAESIDTLEATVIATEENIEATTRNLNVRAVVNTKSSSVVSGAFAKITVVLGEKKEALLVPTQAIIPQARDKKIIVAKGGKANFVTVKIGVRQSANVEITEGIQVGDTVVTTGVLFLKPDAPVKFTKVQ